MEKYVFFIDIDGTLVDNNREVCAYNIHAIKEARDAGNKVFINTGRGRMAVPREVLALDLDGIISGCGSMIEYMGETVFSAQPDNAVIYQYLKDIEARGERCFLEGHNMQFRYNCPREALESDPYFAAYCKMARLVFGEWTPLTTADEFLNYPDAKIPKLNIVGKYDDSALERFSGHYDGITDDCKCELFTKGCGKHIAIKYVMNNILPGYTSVAIGDSENDLLALQSADISVAVKNAAPEIAQMCDYVSERTADEGAVGEMILKIIKQEP